MEEDRKERKDRNLNVITRQNFENSTNRLKESLFSGASPYCSKKSEYSKENKNILINKQYVSTKLIYEGSNTIIYLGIISFKDKVKFFLFKI